LLLTLLKAKRTNRRAADPDCCGLKFQNFCVYNGCALLFC
jgi:hypothetical protein